MRVIHSRRDFLASASLAAAASVFGVRGSLADEGPPETTRVRLKQSAGICFAPAYVVEPFLRAEGFTDIRIWMPALVFRRARSSREATWTSTSPLLEPWSIIWIWSDR